MKNKEKEKEKDIEVGVEGGILIPKDLRKTKYLIVQLKLNLGKADERLYLTLETMSRFEVEKDSDEISEKRCVSNVFRLHCRNLERQLKKVHEAYGIPVVDLPPFEEETEVNNVLGTFCRD